MLSSATSALAGFRRRCLPLLTLIPALAALPAPAHAEVHRTQSISLREGWNAIFLEVQPSPAHPSQVFHGLPVDVVTSFLPGSAGEKFLRQPGDAPWKDEAWRTWQAPHRPESFLSNLHAIQSHRPYLVLARHACVWNVRGLPSVRPIEWEPDSCTFTGLPVDPANPPTFAQFFAGSPAHARHRFYRLEDGLWKRVRSPDQEPVRSGEAYWIQTDGASAHQGPLGLRLPSTGRLNFGETGAETRLELRNTGSSTARVRISVADDPGTLPLHRRVPRLSRRTTERVRLGGEPLDLPALAPNAVLSLVLAPDRLAMSQPTGEALLRVADERGVVFWIPVTAQRFTQSLGASSLASPNLTPAANAASASDLR